MPNQTCTINRLFDRYGPRQFNLSFVEFDPEHFDIQEVINDVKAILDTHDFLFNGLTKKGHKISGVHFAVLNTYHQALITKGIESLEQNKKLAPLGRDLIEDLMFILDLDDYQSLESTMKKVVSFCAEAAYINQLFNAFDDLLEQMKTELSFW